MASTTRSTGPGLLYEPTDIWSGLLSLPGSQDPAADSHRLLQGSIKCKLASFYVDDLLAGADTVAQAVELFRDLREMLSKGGFDLKKWRSNSSEVLKAIPPDLQEPVPTQDLVDLHSAQYPKALGVTWDSKKDNMSTHVQLPCTFVSTKHGVISDIARTFDVLGWIAPVILQMKVVFQQLWQLKIGWDEELPMHGMKSGEKSSHFCRP